MTSPAYAVVDLGASSGRVMIGLCDGKNFALRKFTVFQTTVYLLEIAFTGMCSVFGRKYCRG